MSIYLLLFLLLCCILAIIILIINSNKKQKTLEQLIFDKHKIEAARKEELKSYFQAEWDKEQHDLNLKKESFKNQLNLDNQKLQSNFQLEKARLDNEISQLRTLLKEKEERYEVVNQDLETYRKNQIKEIDNTVFEYQKRKYQIVDHAAEEHKLALQERNGQLEKSLKAVIEELHSQIDVVKKELEEEQSKRAAINEEILRQRRVEEQQDFYRIQLDPNDKDDVEILRSVAPRLRHPEAINKVIWSAYYQKPLAELRKRLLPDGDKSGVYKITRLKTGEIYIGQTTSFDKRFQEHTKSALGCGTLASSQLHRTMAQDGPENFIFELLEEVPKDKLKERESYYIDFYDSKTYGLNTIRGEQK